MDNPFLTAPTWGRRRILTTAGLAALLVATLLTVTRCQQGAAPASAEVGAGASTAAVSTSSSAAAGASGSSRASQAAPMALVRGKALRSGVLVGYPHSVVGAVSAAVEYNTQAGSTLDLQRAGQIGVVVTQAASYQGRAREMFMQGAMDARTYLGVAASGPVPQGAWTTFGPMAYQLRDESTNAVTVLLLSYYTLESPLRGLEQRLIVVPSRMVWEEGDWRIARRPEGSNEYLELRLRPGTAAARAAGWLDFLTP